MLSASSCSAACSRCGGHCNELARACMLPPGRHGPQCNVLSAFDFPGSSLSEHNVTVALPRRYLDHEVGSRGLFCTHIKAVMVETRSLMTKWAKASARRKHRDSRMCFGCRSGEKASSTACCNGHGRCKHGWCACDHSFFGIDCAHQGNEAMLPNCIFIRFNN